LHVHLDPVYPVPLTEGFEAPFPGSEVGLVQVLKLKWMHFDLALGLNVYEVEGFEWELKTLFCGFVPDSQEEHFMACQS